MEPGKKGGVAMKRRVAILLLLFFFFAGLFACEDVPDGVSATPAPGQTTQADDAVLLTMYTIGTPQRDHRKVLDGLNELLPSRAGVQLDWTMIDWSDYESRVSMMVGSGEYFDILFSWGNLYLQNSQRGTFLRLNELLDTHGQGILEVVTPIFWEGVTIGGSIYGIPTNKEVATPWWWMYPTELVEKYNIDIAGIKTLKDLGPVLALIREKEPEWQLMQLDRETRIRYGFEEIVTDIPAVVRLTDSTARVVNLYEQPEVVSDIYTLRDYYLAGYINSDAATKDTSKLEKGEKVFWRQAQGGPFSDVVWSIDRGYELSAVPVEDNWASTDSTRGSIMSISGASRYPAESMRFLNVLNTDPDVRNMIGFGFEDLHYTVTSDGKVSYLPAHENYEVPQYTLQNWFILRPLENDPADKWEVFKAFNAEAMPSPLLGFVPDTSSVEAQLIAVLYAAEEFRPALMTGTVDPDVYLPLFNQKLAEAGLGDILAEFQAQVDAFLSR